MRLAPRTYSVPSARRLEPLAYTLLAAFITLAVALRFYGSLRLQTLHAIHWAHPDKFDLLVGERRGPWSAPLDDVFIHFDFARSTARGFPFQWSEGNGYSSGGTSLLYPFVLALGYWAPAFRELRLMYWAAIVACVCTFGLLLGARRLATELPRLATYLLPFGLLSVGTLDWSLFSGMEVALFLGLWMAAYLACDDLVTDPEADSQARLLRRAAVLGLCSTLVVATRPEGITAVAVLAAAAVLGRKLRDPKRVFWVLALALGPACCVLIAQSVANRYFTGESTAAGALVKLEANHPYLDRWQVFESWLFFIKYQAVRVTQYHFGDRAAYGWLAWLLGLCALGFKSTRRPATIVWASAVLWVLTVAANGQVRWQNERYTMPAVAWLLMAATLGTGALLNAAWELRRKLRGPLIAAFTLSAAGLFIVHQAPRFREQVWFFGRAARNILDQHVQAGLRLRFKIDPQPKRVLVGDAGAIPYISDLPALDIIGLGGYKNLPFARATRAHVGAGIELIERLSAAERPDMMAIYPGWWGELPLWFGQEVDRVPVRGNVICGGASKVLYRPDWAPLDASGRPFSLRAGERVLDSVDPADLVNEREHGYRLEGAPGFIAMKMLRNPATGQPLWDAGRVVPASALQSFYVSGLDPSHKLRLIVRVAPTEVTHLQVQIDGKAAGALTIQPSGGWVEATLEHLTVGGPRAQFKLGPGDHECIVHHVFVVREP
ncbi:MAG TPA: hypothetical protein VG937_00740 [Polyangiaceae bacterium]|nr:hypothetical protein [Polyangiaceae bacterium]